MGTTDDPSLVSGVLHNLLENGTPTGKDGVRYLLGEISGLSETAELRVLKKLHDDNVLKVHSYMRSNGESYPINDDFTKTRRKNPAYKFLVDPSFSAFITTEPVSVFLSYEKARVQSEINRLKKPQSVVKGDRILEKDEYGNFVFNGVMLMTRNQPLDKEVKHYKVLDVLYECHDQHGRVSADSMIREMQKRNEWLDKSDEWVLKRVRDTLDGALFTKVWAGKKRFENRLPGKKEKIISTYKKKDGAFAGWQLNNSLVR